jgi:transposase InsO family protein
MKRLGLQGVRRGKVVRTTISDMKAQCPLDRVNRQFKAERPNQLWARTSPTFQPGRAGCTWPS